MRALRWVLPFLTVLPMAGQTFEVNLFGGAQQYASASITQTSTVAGISWGSGTSGTTWSGPSGTTSILLLRLGVRVLEINSGFLQVTAGYQPTVTTDQTTVTFWPWDPFQLGGPTSRTTSSHYAIHQESLGIQYQSKTRITWGAGLELRLEHLCAGTVATDYLCPWCRLNAGYVFPGHAVLPLIGVEADFALDSQSAGDTPNSTSFLRAGAPKEQYGIYAGLRF